MTYSPNTHIAHHIYRQRYGIAHAVVLKLVEGLENKGYHVYCDNYYSSPNVISAVRHLGFGGCVTVRVDRQRMPQVIADTKMKKGEASSFEVEKGMVALDKRHVTVLSTIHDSSVVAKRGRSQLVPGGFEEIGKSAIIAQYNMYMHGVDKGDQ